MMVVVYKIYFYRLQILINKYKIYKNNFMYKYVEYSYFN